MALTACGGGAPDGGKPTRTPSTHAAPTRSASPAACKLKVVKKGFTTINWSEHGYGRAGTNRSDADIQFAVIVHNPCKRAAVDIAVDVFARDETGSRMRNLDDEAIDESVSGGARIDISPPGADEAATGSISNAATTDEIESAPEFDAKDVSDIEVVLRCDEWRDYEDGPVVTAQRERIGKKTPYGSHVVSFSVSIKSKYRLNGDLRYCIVLEDEAGKIITGGMTGTLDSPVEDGHRVVGAAVIPRGVQHLHVEVFVTPDPREVA